MSTRANNRKSDPRSFDKSLRIVVLLTAFLTVSIAILGQCARWVDSIDSMNSFAPFIIAISATLLLVLLLLRPARSGISLTCLLIALLCAGERVAPELMRRPSQVPASRDKDVVILTANVWRDNPTPEAAVRAIIASGADVVFLQEASGVMATERLLLESRFPYGGTCRDNRCELDILSRWPMKRVRYKFRDALDRPFGPALMQTVVMPPDRPAFMVATLHLERSGPLSRVSHDRIEELITTFAQALDAHAIIGGDMNLTPWSFGLQKLDAGIVPMNRITGHSPTYPANLLLTGMTVPPVLPIDQIYAGPAWAAREIKIMDMPGSDHRAVRAVLVPL